MMETTTTAKSRKHHYYVAVWPYGIGVTNDEYEPYVSYIAFDSKADADSYTEKHRFEDGHSYAERVDADNAVRDMRKQLFGALCDVCGVSRKNKYAYADLRFKVAQMSVEKIIAEYRVYVYRLD